MYQGDIRLGDTIDFKFTTRAFATGIPTLLTGSPAIVAYVNNSTTEITSGLTLTTNFDSLGAGGLNNVRVVATSGNGFAAGDNVSIVISAGTVGGTSVVGEVVGELSIEARSALRPTTAGRTLDVSTGGEAGLDWANIGSPTTSQTLSGTTISTSQVVASVTGAVGSVTGAVGSVTGNVGGNVVGSVGSVVGNVGGNVTGSVGSVVGNVGGNVVGNVNGNVVGSVGSVVGNVGGNVVGSVGSVTGNVGGNVTGSVGSVVGSVGGNLGGSVLGNVVGDIGGDLFGNVNGSLLGDVQGDVLGVLVDLSVTARPEPGQGNPAVNAATSSKIDYLYKAWRNKTTQTSAQYSLFDDSGAVIDQKATFADNGTTATRGEVTTGP